MDEISAASLHDWMDRTVCVSYPIQVIMTLAFTLLITVFQLCQHINQMPDT